MGAAVLNDAAASYCDRFDTMRAHHTAQGFKVLGGWVCGGFYDFRALGS